MSAPSTTVSAPSAANPLSSAQSVRKSLSQSRKDDLRHDAAWLAKQLDLTDEAQFTRLMKDLSSFYGFLGQWLSPDPSHPFTHELAQEAHRFSHQFHGVQPPSASIDLAWLQSIQSILINRRDDALALQEATTDPALTHELWEAIARRRLEPAAEVPPLAPEKQDQLLESLIDAPGGGVEPAAHIHMTARGHRHGHAALAAAFEHSAPTAIMTAHAGKALPDLSAEHLAIFADHWMQMRAERARQVSQVLEAEGPLVQRAIHLSEQTRVQAAQGITPAAAASEKAWHISQWLDNIVASGPRPIESHAEESTTQQHAAAR